MRGTRTPTAGSGRAAGSSGAPFRRLLGELRASRALVVLTIVCGTAARAAEIALAGGAAWLVVTAVGDADLAALRPGVVVVVVATLVSLAAGYAEQWAGHEAAFRTIAELRSMLFAGIRRASPQLPSGRRTGDVAAAAMGDAEALEWFYAHAVPNWIIAALVPAVAVTALAWLSPATAAIVSVAAAGVVVVTFVAAPASRRQGAAVRAAVARVHADVLEAVQATRDVVLLRAEAVMRDRIARGADQVAGARSVFGRRRGLEAAATDLVVGGAMFAVLLTAMRFGPHTSVPVLVVLAGATLAPITRATSTASNLGQTRASAVRVLEILDAPPNVPTGSAVAGRDARLADHTAVVVFDHVTFTYPGSGRPALREVSFGVEAGEVVALAGDSGAGKTTCLRLLLRQWDPDGGRILLEGKDLRSEDPESLLPVVAHVPQHGGLIGDSLVEALTLGAPRAPEHELRRACRIVGMDELVGSLPHGLATTLGEGGATLSGGQRQRLAVARALVVSPRLLVLDEPVSHLDAPSARAIEAAIGEIAQNGTAVLLVAHRHRTLRSADRIVRLDQGRVVGGEPSRSDYGEDPKG